MRQRFQWVWVCLAFVASVDVALAAEVGLVTAVSGNVRLEPGPRAADAASTAVLPFMRLNEGDRVSFEPAARLQVVYFDGGRQENWRGSGVLNVGKVSSRVVQGSLQPELKQIPPAIARQIAKTPPPDGSLPTEAQRTRSMPSGGTLESVERNYAELRKQAESADRNPEIYLLASYFELKEFAKLEELLKQLGDDKTGDPEVRMLKSLYARAIRNAKIAAAK